MCEGRVEAVPGLVGYSLLKSGSEFLTPPTAAELRLPTRVPLATAWNNITQSTQAGGKQ